MNRQYWENNVPNSTRIPMFDKLCEYANEAVGESNYHISFRKTQITLMLVGKNSAFAGFYPQHTETFKFAVQLDKNGSYDERIKEIRDKYNISGWIKRNGNVQTENAAGWYSFALRPTDVSDQKKEAYIQLFRMSYEFLRPYFAIDRQYREYSSDNKAEISSAIASIAGAEPDSAYSHIQKGVSVLHKDFGNGVVVEISKGIIHIAFDYVEKKFAFPDAFSKKHLILIDTPKKLHYTYLVEEDDFIHNDVSVTDKTQEAIVQANDDASKNETIKRKECNDLSDEKCDMIDTVVRVLYDLSINGEIIESVKGPVVTRYHIKIPTGSRLKNYTTRAEDIALALGVQSIAITPIVGTPLLLGMDVPNKERELVLLKGILASPEADVASNTSFGLGKSVYGRNIMTDIVKMPHLLISGTTGSGKSVCINTIIYSLLKRNNPEELQFVMIDPKMVELSGYDGVPHLLMPVVTDMRLAMDALSTVVNIMEERYLKLMKDKVRDIDGYNRLNYSDKMSRIIVIIDEMADLMITNKAAVEDYIIRIAQKARACGIHMIVATQRPERVVITGLIKANIPSRISFMVRAKVDSRIIIDEEGAENLLGKGDMLYFPVGQSAAERVQGCWIDDNSIEKLVEQLRASVPKVDTNFTEIKKGEEINKLPTVANLRYFKPSGKPLPVIKDATMIMTDIAAIADGDRTLGLTTDGHVMPNMLNGKEKVLEEHESLQLNKLYIHESSKLKNVAIVSKTDYIAKNKKIIIVALRSDGTITTTNNSLNYQVKGWSSISAISICGYSGNEIIIGLKENGTIIATQISNDNAHNYDFSNWKDVVAISSDGYCVIGLRTNGTIVATNLDDEKILDDITGWRDIVAISADLHIVGLRKNGTVVATGDNTHGQLNVNNWKGIISVSAGYNITVGLKGDGTVVAVGNNEHEACNVRSWTDIVAVSAKGNETLGLRSDGTLITTSLSAKVINSISNFNYLQKKMKTNL